MGDPGSMTDHQRTQKQKRAKDHEHVGGVEDVRGPDCKDHVVADIAQGEPIHLVAQGACQKQSSRRGIELTPAITVQHDRPAKNHTQDDEPDDRQATSEEWSAMAFQAVDSTVIPTLGAYIKTGDDLPDSGRLSPRRESPPLAQLIKAKANSRGDKEHDQEGAMPGDFPLQQRRGSRRVSHENSL